MLSFAFLAVNTYGYSYACVYIYTYVYKHSNVCLVRHNYTHQTTLASLAHAATWAPRASHRLKSAVLVDGCALHLDWRSLLLKGAQDFLESQVAQHNRPLHRKVAHN